MEGQRVRTDRPARMEQQQYNVAGKPMVKGELTPSMLEITHIDPPKEAKIPQLSNGLDRVLFNPGVHVIRDLRTNVYNFDPSLQKLVQPEEFNYDCLPSFIPPYKDANLRTLAREKKAKFVSSTSSISATLGMIYYVVSNMKQLNLTGLSSIFGEENKNFTLMTRSPTSVILRPHGDGIRSIVTEKVDSAMNVLSYLGQSMEKLLTCEKSEFQTMLKTAEVPYKTDGLDGYAHTLAGSMLMRSQLDCYDPRLPRKTFDLKTRATLPIRMDVANYKRHLDYRLTSHTGLYGSYEREFYDMCRSALLKYNFQVRIGNMDGIFVAYHNTAEIFGFQYLSREVMDEYLFGNGATGDACFLMITKLYNEILELIVPQYQADENIRLTFSVSKTGSRLTVFAESIPEPEGRQIVPNASNFRQFSLNTHSTVNGIRTEDILLHPHGYDTWKLSYSLAEVQPELGEFMSARVKAAELISGGAVGADLDGTAPRSFNESFFKGIQASIHSNKHLGTEEAEPVIASWTMPK